MDEGQETMRSVLINSVQVWGKKKGKKSHYRNIQITVHEWGVCMCDGRAALFAVALVSGTPATGSPEWRLSVTLYQLPTRQCFTSLCELPHCSHLCLLSLPPSLPPSRPRVASLLLSLPSCPCLHFSTPSYILWLQLAFLNTLLLSAPFSPHLTPHPCFPSLVLVLQLDCVWVHARVQTPECVQVPMLPVDNRTARVGKIVEWGKEVQGFHFLLEQNMPVGPAGINWKCNLGLWADTQVGLEVWRRESGNKGPFLCAGTPEWMLLASSGEPELPPGSLLQTWTPWGGNWLNKGVSMRMGGW